jgi:rSAM/selenodomain-associated transferase 1
MSDLGTRLIVFLKAPRPGFVKTRLAATLGDGEAANVYSELVRISIENIASLSNVELRFTPDDAREEMLQWSRPSWGLRAQGSGDLGSRLDRAFSDAFLEGFRGAIAIGSDCPEMTRKDVEGAERLLGGHDVVVGPAGDGGYWLIGLRRPVEGFFDGIAWSTNQVLSQTEDAARRRGLTVARLRVLDDIDTEEDWRRWQALRSTFVAGRVEPKASETGRLS